MSIADSAEAQAFHRMGRTDAELADRDARTERDGMKPTSVYLAARFTRKEEAAA